MTEGFTNEGGHVGPMSTGHVPRFGGPPTFARLPRIDQVPSSEIAVVGMPFDTGVSYRPGARFGPAAVRAGSRLLRPHNPGLDVSPFARKQVVDAGDIGCDPYHVATAIESVRAGAAELLDAGNRVVAVGGDHTIALPMLRALAQRHGPLALLHFDAHLDTWDTYFGEPYTHGTPFRRASEEGLLDADALCHVGTRGPLYGQHDLDDDTRIGFGIVTSADVMHRGVRDVARQLRERVGRRPLYVSVDIDVLDPAHAPGTGTPEAGGMTSRELLEILRGLADLRIVSADVVEVAPAYDHAEITALAAAHVTYDLVSLLSLVD